MGPKGDTEEYGREPPLDDSQWRGESKCVDRFVISNPLSISGTLLSLIPVAEIVVEKCDPGEQRQRGQSPTFRSVMPAATTA